MYVKSYCYESGSEVIDRRVVVDRIERGCYTTQAIGDKVKTYLREVETSGKTALLYAAGPAIHHSDGRNIPDVTKDGMVVVKSQLGYNAYNVARLLNVDIDYMSINANTCASSMYSLYEAKQLLNNGYTDVVVFAIDIVDDTQELLFKQLGIDLVCGDGVVAMHLTSNKTSVEIPEVVWKWNKDTSPMSVSKEGYLKVLNELDTKEIDLVKSHGSGTARNTDVELSAISESIGDAKVVEYKSKIGHTQGVSALIEICMLLDESDWKKSVCLASGLGGFYGGCTIRRNT
jgi:hypothetical protein